MIRIHEYTCKNTIYRFIGLVIEYIYEDNSVIVYSQLAFFNLFAKSLKTNAERADIRV